MQGRPPADVSESPKLFEPLDAGDERDADGRASLPQQRLLRVQEDRAVAGAVDPELRAAEETEPQTEADLRAAVEAEEVRREVAEVALAERPREAVRQPEGQLVPRQPLRSSAGR